jgi:hypothetical protein
MMVRKHHDGQKNRTWPKKLPRSSLEQAPEDVYAVKKRRMSKHPNLATPKRYRTQMD